MFDDEISSPPSIHLIKFRRSLRIPIGRSRVFQHGRAFDSQTRASQRTNRSGNDQLATAGPDAPTGQSLMRSLSCFSAAILGGKLTSTRSRDSAETPWGLTRLATWRFFNENHGSPGRCFSRLISVTRKYTNHLPKENNLSFNPVAFRDCRTRG
mgnify:CR=1 FL=1